MPATLIFFLLRVCRSLRFIPRLALLLVVAASLAAGPLARGAAAGARRHYELAAGDAETMLKRFVEVSGEQLVYVVPRVRGVKTNPVSGDFTPREALDRMVANTALVVIEDKSTGALMVNRSGGESVPPAEAPTEKPKKTAVQPGKPTDVFAKLAAAAALWFASTANDLAAATPADTAATAKDEAIALSPFTVDASRDIGYVANNTLAGSRLNTSLKDTAATISVMTEEFLTDLGAFTVNDAMLYAGNLQIDQEETVNGTPTGNLVSEGFPTYRVRGMKATVARNYFSWNVPSNTYNIERIDESRGPNSVLFGVGGAGGIVNTSTKQAQLGRARESVSFSVGSFDSQRATIDANQPLLKNKLAVRLNGLWSDTNTSREYSDAHERRGHLTTLYLPFTDTRIRAEVERGQIRDHVSRPWPVIDSVTLWNSRGRPLRATQTASAADGIARLAAATPRLTFIENTNSFIDLKGTLTSNTSPALQNTMITDRSIADDSVNPAGPGAQRDTRLTNYMASIEQKLPAHSYLSLAFNHQHYDFVGHALQQTDNTLWGDPNQLMPVNATATQANPYAGRYYVEGTWTRRHRYERFNTVRATFTNEFDLRRLGQYRWAALAEQESSAFARDERVESLVGRPYNAVPQNPANRIFRRYYVTEGVWSTYRVPAALDGLIENRTDPVNGRAFTSNWIQGNANIDDDRQRTRTALVGGQGSWFNHRLIGTFGFRRDQVDLADRGTKVDPVSGEFSVDYGTVTKSREIGSTRTWGAVWHATRHLSATYNQSTNNAPANNAIRVLPDSDKAAEGHGEGRDVGLTLDLFDGKVFAKALYYTTAGRRETDFRSVSVLAMQRNDRVLDALVNARLITNDEAGAHRVIANGGYSDRESNGWEFRLVANPRPNLRLQANYSITEAVEKNILPEVRAWAEREIAYWSRFDTRIPTASIASIAQEITNLRDDLAAQTSAEGLGAIGNRRYKGNVFGRYDFTSTWARGCYVGGGYRYQGKMLIGRNATTGGLQYTGATVRTDALLGYRTKLPGNRGRIFFQLNIDNVLDDTDPVILRRTDAGFVRRFSVAEPRTYRLSTTLQF